MKTVQIEQPIKKLGNSSGVIIPAATLRELGLAVSDIVKLEITPKKQKPAFDIQELMANTDFDAQRQDPSLADWNALSSVGREIG